MFYTHVHCKNRTKFKDFEMKPSVKFVSLISGHFLLHIHSSILIVYPLPKGGFQTSFLQNHSVNVGRGGWGVLGHWFLGH